MRSEKSMRRAAALVSMLFVAGLVAACAEDDEGGASDPAAAPPVNPELSGEVKLGAVLPLTGSSASIGEDQQRGIDLAVEQINAADGVLGKELVIVSEDSAGESASAVQAAKKLANVDDAPVVIGEYLSNHTIAIGDFLQSAGVVHIQAGSSSTDIRNIGDYSFGVIGLDDIVGKFVANELFEAGYERVAYLGPNNAYGAEFERVLTENLEELGGEITESVLYTEGETSYKSELQRIDDSDPDMVALASYLPDSATITREAFQLGMDASDFFGIYLSLIAQDAEPAAVEGMTGSDLQLVGDGGESYVEAYEAKYGESPQTPYSSYTYDAVMIAVEAINEAGSEDPTAIRDALRSLEPFEGVTGEIVFDADRQRTALEYGLFEVNESGTLATIDQIPPA